MDARLRALWPRSMGAMLLPMLLLPLAGAQVPPLETAQLEIEPFAGPVAPLLSELTTNFTARISCLALDPPVGTPVTYTLVAKPAWANVTLDPATDVLTPLACQASPDGWVSLHGTVRAKANDQAPAFAPEPITVEVVAGPEGPRQGRAEATTPLAASYFAVLGVQLAEAIGVVAPGGSIAFPLTLTNHGNGPTRVTIVVTESSGGLVVDIPSEATLERPTNPEAPEGAARTTINVTVRASEREGYVNEVGMVNLRLEARYAPDPSLSGDTETDTSTVSLVVTVRSPLAQMSDVPMGPLAPLAVMLALLIAGRSWGAARRR